LVIETWAITNLEGVCSEGFPMRRCSHNPAYKTFVSGAQLWLAFIYITTTTKTATIDRPPDSFANMSFPSPTATYHTSAYPAIDPRLPALSSNGKNIVISGGGSGIGFEIAKAFAQSGAASLALLGRTEETLLKAKKQIEAEFKTTKVSTYVIDVVSPADLERSLAAHADAEGELHVLIANAGALPLGQTIVGSSAEEWYNGFEVNVKGNFNLVRAFLPHAVENAVILNTNTAAVHIPYVPGMSGYATSKLAAAKFFEYLHHEHPNFFIMNIHPGVIKTAMSDKTATSGVTFPFDNSTPIHIPPGRSHIVLTIHTTVNLPASFMVWAASSEAKFLNGKFVWAHWDVNELKAAAATSKETDKFTLGLLGWP
jgi:NAD(P)-dependent dehydrogenase (short-subunit alcohol dehydrogenase family)